MSENAPIRWRDFRWAMALAALSWLVALWLFAQLPEQVPVHWNAAGEPDRWGSRAEGAFIVPALIALLVPLFAVLPRLDPRRASYASFRRPYLLLVHGIVVFMLFVQGLMAAQMLGSELPLGRGVPVGVGLLFAGIGALLPRLRPNWFAGIRTPWTLEDDRVWERTHRVGGKLFVAAGAVIAVAGLLAPAPWMVWVIVGAALGAGLGSVVYSYVVWRRLHSPAARAGGG